MGTVCWEDVRQSENIDAVNQGSVEPIDLLVKKSLFGE